MAEAIEIISSYGPHFKRGIIYIIIIHITTRYNYECNVTATYSTL